MFVVRGVRDVGGSVLKAASGGGYAGTVELRVHSPLYADGHVNLC